MPSPLSYCPHSSEHTPYLQMVSFSFSLHHPLSGLLSDPCSIRDIREPDLKPPNSLHDTAGLRQPPSTGASRISSLLFLKLPNAFLLVQTQQKEELSRQEPSQC